MQQGEKERMKVLLGRYDEKRILKSNGIYAWKRYHWSPLHFAVYTGNVELVKILASHGFSFDVKDIYGMTPRKLNEMLCILREKS